MKTLNPKWLEQFDLYMFEDQTSNLEISVCDHDVGGRDDIMGRYVILTPICDIMGRCVRIEYIIASGV